MIWDYVCGVEPIKLRPLAATAVGGQWDYQSGVDGGGRKYIEQGDSRYDTQITFACTNGAIGKCVEKMHYKPWAPAARECAGPWFNYHCYQPTQELLHEACVRMVRADYCGDGQTHTINGISVDVWDQSAIETMTPYSQTSSNGGIPYGHEAEWTPNGARCLSNILMTRTSHLGTDETVGMYLMDGGTVHRPWCVNKWGTNTSWANGDCFGMGPQSQHSTFDFANVPWSPFTNVPAMDMHDRVYIKNKSVCIDDGRLFDGPNPMKTENPWCGMCLPDPSGPVVTCPPIGNSL
jgi:hypothetical protein